MAMMKINRVHNHPVWETTSGLKEKGKAIVDSVFADLFKESEIIDKDALVAEIEKLMYAANLEADIASTGECFDEKVAEAKYQLCKRIISIINPLEVKEVDIDNHTIMEEIRKCGCNPNEFDIAKHFFELGLKVNNEKEK